MNGCTLVRVVLLSQNFSVSSYQIFDVLIQQAGKFDREFLVALDCVAVVLDSRVELTVFDVNRFDAVLRLGSLKFVVEHFFQANSVVVDQHLETFDFAAVANCVIDISLFLREVDFMEQIVRRSAFLHTHVKNDVGKSMETTHIRKERLEVLLIKNAKLILNVFYTKERLTQRCQVACGQFCLFGQ